MQRSISGVFAIIIIFLIVGPKQVFAQNNVVDYRMSPQFTILTGGAKTKAANYESSGYAHVFISKPIFRGKYSLDIGWKRFNQFRHKGFADTGYETRGYTLGVTSEIYRKKRLRIDAGLTSLSYKSYTTFLNKSINQSSGYTWGALVRSSVNFRVVALNFGIEWHKGISNAPVSIIYLGISFNLGPMFGF